MRDDVLTEILEDVVVKRSLSVVGYRRVKREIEIYHKLVGMRCIAKLISIYDNGIVAEIRLEKIAGENLKQIIDLKDNWMAKSFSWHEAEAILVKYVDIETELLTHSAMYRDLNLEHIILLDKKYTIVDLESVITKQPQEVSWRLNDRRGTYETMAPEEFAAKGVLTQRVATYRFAVVAYLLLVGRPPFPHSTNRHDAYKIRKQYVELYFPEDVNKRARRVFNAALSRHPSRRHASPKRFLDALTASIKQ